MTCPHCQTLFTRMVANMEDPFSLSNVVPVLCQECGSISMAERSGVRFASKEEMLELKKSEVWQTQIEPAQRLALQFRKARLAILN